MDVVDDKKIFGALGLHVGIAGYERRSDSGETFTEKGANNCVNIGRQVSSLKSEKASLYFSCCRETESRMERRLASVRLYQRKTRCFSHCCSVLFEPR